MIFILFLILAILISLLVAFSVKTGVYLLIFFSIFQLSYFHRWDFLNVARFWAWIPFFFAIVLLIPLSHRLLVSKKLFSSYREPIILVFFATSFFVLLSLISAAINSVSLLTALFGLRYILFFTVFCALLYGYKVLNLDLVYFCRFIFCLAIIQVPFAFLQRIMFSFFGVVLRSETSDLISGTFSDYATLGFVQLFAIGIAIAYWIRTTKGILGRFTPVLILIIFLPLFLSNSRAVFIFLAILFFVIVLRFRARLVHLFVKNFVFMALLTILLYVGVVYIFGNFQKLEYGRDLKEQYSWDYIIDYNFSPTLNWYSYTVWGGDPRMGRLTSIRKAFELIKDEPLKLLFGLGSGNTQESQVFNSQGRYYQKHGSLAGLSRNQISLVLSEFGLLGILSYFIFTLLFWLKIKKISHGSKPRDNFLTDVNLLFFLFLFLFSIYDRILTDYAIIFIGAYFISVAQERFRGLYYARNT